MLANPEQISYDFGDRSITGLGGLAAFTRMANRLVVHDLLRGMSPLRSRQRKVHDA